MQAHQTQQGGKSVLGKVSPVTGIGENSLVEEETKQEIFSSIARKEIVGPYSAIDPRAVQMMNIHNSLAYTSPWQQSRIQYMLLKWFLLNSMRDKTKRVFDLLLSIMVLPLVLPIMAVTAIAIKLDTPGPIFFKQERVGKWGKKFFCYKFRSMVVDAEARKKELLSQNEADSVVFKMKRDPRITRVGRIIRKLSIDELPQIINVIKGEMSIVGPRPPVPYEVAQYQFEHFRRLDAIPGITGLQQVVGRSGLTFTRWVELDVQYIQEQSLKKDIEIILKTVPAVITSRGAY